MKIVHLGLKCEYMPNSINAPGYTETPRGGQLKLLARVISTEWIMAEFMKPVGPVIIISDAILGINYSTEAED